MNTRIHSFPHFSLTCIEILSWNFAYDFVLLYNRWRVSSICVNFCGSYALLNLEYWIYTVFHTFLFTALTYWAEILHMTLSYCTTDQECRQFASIFVGVMPPLELRILEIHSFQHFSLTCFDMLSLDFSHDFFKCTIYQDRVSSLCAHLVLRASTHFLHVPPSCMDKFSRN